MRGRRATSNEIERLSHNVVVNGCLPPHFKGRELMFDMHQNRCTKLTPSLVPDPNNPSEYRLQYLARYCKRSLLGLFGSGNETNSHHAWMLTTV